MSLETCLGAECNLFEESPAHAPRLTANLPVLTEAAYAPCWRIPAGVILIAASISITRLVKDCGRRLNGSVMKQ